jgi:hypothetical protein
MTWVWILLFVLACTVPLTAYIYVVEIREAIADDPVADEALGPEVADDSDRVAA